MNELEIVSLSDYSPIGDSHKEDVCRDIQKKIRENAKNNSLSVIILNGDEADKKDLRVFRSFNGEYWTQGYVGVISDGEHQIVINSRFDDDNRQFFLQYVFAKAFDNNGKIFEDMKPLGNPEMTWDLLLLVMFINQMKTAMRKGLFRKYRQFSYNDPRVKGQIDIARHIRENPISNGKIAYNTREYTVDNFYNMLFLRAYDRMEKKYPTAVKNMISGEPEVKNALALLRSSVPQWNTVSERVILNKTDRKIVNSVYRSFEPLRVTSRIILRRLGINSFHGSRSNVSGVLIYMPKLWEKFLEKTSLSPMEAQNKNKFYILDGKWNIKPDFYWAEKKMVVDAKYKAAWGKVWEGESDKRKNVRDDVYQVIRESDKWENVRNDVYQVMAYMLALDCTKGGIVFPYKPKEFTSEEDMVSRMKKAFFEDKYSVFPKNFTHSGENRHMFLLPFYIYENAESFSDFRERMEYIEGIIRSLLDTAR